MIQQEFELLKKRAHANRFDQPSDRIARLRKVQTWIKKNEILIIEALKKDFNKPAFETQLTEITTVLKEIKETLQKLPAWTKDKKVPTPLSLLGHSSRIRYENKGVVLIMAPWNYPFYLTLSPLIGALAAGNTAVLKPSELTPNTSQVIDQLCKDCFYSDEVLNQMGDKDVANHLLTFQFDHVFFTGSTAVGRLIAMKCAEKLIPYTLELGGKSPVIIDETANIPDAAAKVHWGKYLNRGQTCVAPDYVLVHKNVYQKFIDAYTQISQLDKSGEDISQIINSTHQGRLQYLTENKFDHDLTATTLFPVAEAPRLMQEEIFGPVAAVKSFIHFSDLSEIINQHSHPLALYIFSENAEFCDRCVREFPSGGVGINSINLQLANSNLPFGGIGPSGSGRYHGHFSFLAFSHQRAIISHNWLKSSLQFIFPPYTQRKHQVLRWVKWFNS